VTYFSNFGNPLNLELETSNLARLMLITKGTNNKNPKLGQRGLGKGHVTYF